MGLAFWAITMHTVSIKMVISRVIILFSRPILLYVLIIQQIDSRKAVVIVRILIGKIV